MSYARASSDAANHLPGWAPATKLPGQQSAGLLLVLSIHFLVFWLVLSGRGPQVPRITLPPIIAQILPSPDLPPPKPRTLPVKAVAREYSTAKPLVPEPEETAPTNSAAPILESQSTGAMPAPAQDQPASSGPSDNALPRGFGAISNREACLAAFRASYPREARRTRQEGTVTIAARIGTDGRVLAAEVIASNPRRVFDRAALAVLTSGACTFDPAAADYAWQGEISYRLEGESAE